MKKNTFHKSLKLCLITNYTEQQTFAEYLLLIKEAARAGITMLQLRDKSRSYLEIKQMALELKKLLTNFDIPLIINDYVELAQEIDAEGVHIGQSDIELEKAIKILAPNKIIGVSIEKLSDLKSINQFNANLYVSASAVFQSSTKNNCKTIWGIDGLKEIIVQSLYPVMAIGNINKENAKSVIQAGAAGVAVISALHNSSPYSSTIELLNQL